MSVIPTETQRRLDEIRRVTAAHEAGHATLYFQAGMSCSASISEVLDDSGNITGWSGQCMLTGGDQKHVHEWAPLIGVAGIIGEYLEDDDCPDGDEIIDLWKMGVATPSSSDLESIPASWRLRRRLIIDTLSVLETRREFWKNLKSQLELNGSADSFLASALWRNLFAGVVTD